MSATTETLRQAMNNAGLDPGEIPPADGTIHRFTAPGDKPRSDHGWYILYDMGDMQSGSFGRWEGDNNNAVKWCSKVVTEQSPEEKKQYAAKMDAARRAVAAEQAKVHAECRHTCQVIWAAGTPATDDHPALVRKKVKAYGLKLHKGMLMVPLMDPARIIHGIQFIQPVKPATGPDKTFKAGTAKKGNFHAIGKPVNNTAIVCEGYATGASIHEATGHFVLVAFDAGNLKAVAEVFRKRKPQFKIIIAADNDQWKDVNTGVTAGTVAARAVDGLLAVPMFQNTATKPTDFNDLFVLEGAGAVCRQFEAAATPEPAPTDTPAPADDFQEISEPAKKSPLPKIKTMTDLLNTTFAAIRWVIFGLLPEGLAILSGPPKIGKSWLVMNLCLAVAWGGYVFGRFKVEMGEVLLLSLEDNERRLKGRLLKCMAGENKDLSNFHAITSWKRLDQGGLEDLASWLDLHPACKLVVIDTMQKIKAHAKRKNGNAYENDYDSYGDLQRLALLHCCCILVIHHNRKSDSKNDGDPLEQISGSTGTTGSMDTILMLRRPRGATGAVLTATGRDISEAEYAMNFDGELGQWVVTGQAAEISMKADSSASLILAFMKNNAGSMLSVQDIYEGLGEKIKLDTVKRELGRMTEKDIIQRDKGKFAYFTPISTMSPVSLVPDIFTYRDTKDTKDTIVPKDTKDMNMSGFVDIAGIQTLNESDFEGML